MTVFNATNSQIFISVVKKVTCNMFITTEVVQQTKAEQLTYHSFTEEKQSPKRKTLIGGEMAIRRAVCLQHLSPSS